MPAEKKATANKPRTRVTAKTGTRIEPDKREAEAKKVALAEATEAVEDPKSRSQARRKKIQDEAKATPLAKDESAAEEAEVEHMKRTYRDALIQGHDRAIEWGKGGDPRWPDIRPGVEAQFDEDRAAQRV